MLDFSYKGATISFSTVQAETVKTEGIKDGDLMSTLVMTGVGLIASRLFTCKMTTDMMLAAAGGAAFIAGEILATLKLRKVMKDMETEITRDKNGNIDQKQIDTLVRLKESYQKAKDTATTKKNLQMAAAAAFAAAAVSAYMLYTTEQTALQTCNTALATASASCTAAFTASCAGAGATCYYPFQTGAAQATANVAPISNQAIMSLTPGQSAAKMAADKAMDATNKAALTTMTTQCPAASPGMTACTAMATLNLTTKGYCPAPLALSQATFSKTFIAQNLYTPIAPPKEKFNLFKSIFMSDAKADLFSPLGIASGLAIKYVLATSKTLGMQIDMFLFSPMNRAMTWGVLGGLTFAASSATSNQISKIESNIQKIDSLINGMRSFQNGVAQTKTPSAQNAKIDKELINNRKLNLNDLSNTEIDMKAAGGSNLPCFTGENSDKCPSFSNQLKAQPDISSMPSDVQATISNIGKLGDGLNGTSKITSGTLDTANKLSGQLNALNSEAARRQKEVQDRLKASGSDIDLEKLKSGMRADMLGAADGELKKSKMTASEMLASFGGGRSFGSGMDSVAGISTDANKNAKDTKAANKNSASVAIPVVAIPAAVIPKIDNKSLSDELKEGDANAEGDAALASAEGKAGESMEDYDLKNDITKEKDASIFELISNRYQKSGYPRLFKRIK